MLNAPTRGALALLVLTGRLRPPFFLCGLTGRGAFQFYRLLSLKLYPSQLEQRHPGPSPPRLPGPGGPASFRERCWQGLPFLAPEPSFRSRVDCGLNLAGVTTKRPRQTPRDGSGGAFLWLWSAAFRASAATGRHERRHSRLPGRKAGSRRKSRRVQSVALGVAAAW
jgi:hypothetical protein